MTLDRNAPGAENLAAAGIDQLMRKKLLVLDRLPLPHLIWFRYPETKVLCAAVTSTIGYVHVMYGVMRKFEHIARTISDEQAGRVVSALNSFDSLEFCRAYSQIFWQPGPYAIAAISDAGGSGRAATELKVRRAPPMAGVFFRVIDDDALDYKPINVGLTLYEDGNANFVDVDIDQIIRPLTAEELAYTKRRVMKNDEIEALYYTSEARHGLH